MKIKLLFISLFIVASIGAIATPPAEEGKLIFTARCASCHNVNKVLTGPALAGVHERRSMEWIIAFVKSSQSLIKSGDKEALAIFEKFNNIPMPDHQDLSAESIQHVVEYIKTESQAITAEKVPFEKPAKLRPAYKPLSLTEDAGFFMGFIGVVAVLIMVLLFAVQLKQFERATENELNN